MSRAASLEHTKWFYLVLQLGVKLHDNILVSKDLFALSNWTRNRMSKELEVRALIGLF